MEPLWAPWRMEYIGSAKEEGPGVPLLREAEEGDDEKAYILATTEKSFAMLNAYPYNSGHLMVAPFRHVGELEKVEADELLDMQNLLQRCIRDAARRVQHRNEPGTVAGAGIPDHLHWHVVPCWNGHTNFMPVVGEMKVLPEGLISSHRL